MVTKRMSALKAGLLFLWGLAAYFTFTGFSPSLRHQMASIHSIFWTTAFPGAFCATALFAIAVWFMANNAARLQTWARKR